ncbi:thiol:disulfide oxidoreductase related to ResA [Lachnospiraceae bacterium KM106-2]|nr:thiol:disulfide oxidoreductase related to ResA [Lachnospiraceae bacterium KM106-2]
MKKVKLLLGILAFVIVLAGASYGYGVLKNQYQEKEDVVQETVSPDKKKSEKDSEKDNAQETTIAAEDFTVYRPNGKKASLSDYIGKPIVLNFWASWCEPCKSEMADFQEVYEEMGKDVQFMMVNFTDKSYETKEKASRYIRTQGYTFPVFYDQDGEAVATYGVMSLPTTYFIDKDGNVVNYAYGTLEKESLKKAIEDMLK